MSACSYLTPSATQGFPPHCDDIEAFLLQVEGQKRWRVYAPLSEEESLPRESRQFEQVRAAGAPRALPAHLLCSPLPLARARRRNLANRWWT